MVGRHHHRRPLAVATCVLWLLGIEVLPNLHLATHDRDHTHTADGTIVRVTFDATHRHADGSIHAHDDVIAEGAAAKTKRLQLAFDQVLPPAHAAGGVAHHAVALRQPAPPSHEPIELERLSWRIELEASDQIPSTIAVSSTARGPPAV